MNLWLLPLDCTIKYYRNDIVLPLELCLASSLMTNGVYVGPNNTLPVEADLLSSIHRFAAVFLLLFIPSVFDRRSCITSHHIYVNLGSPVTTFISLWFSRGRINLKRLHGSLEDISKVKFRSPTLHSGLAILTWSSFL